MSTENIKKPLSLELTVNTKNSDIERLTKEKLELEQQLEIEKKAREELEQKITEQEASPEEGSASGSVPLTHEQKQKESPYGKYGDEFSQGFDSHSDMVEFLQNKAHFGSGEEKVRAKDTLQNLLRQNIQAIKKSGQTVIFEDDFSSIDPSTGQRESLIKRTLRLQNEHERQKLLESR
jgi:hypothetical protein